MIRSRLIVGLAGILLLILGACAQQAGDIAGQAITTLAQFDNRDCSKFALPAVECPTVSADRAAASLTPTAARIVLTNSLPDLNNDGIVDTFDTDNDGNVFIDTGAVVGSVAGDLIDDDARLDDKDTPNKDDDVILNKDLPPRPLVTVYDDQFTNPPPFPQAVADLQFNPASDPTNVLSIQLGAVTPTNPKEVLLVNRVGFVFNRGKARWEAIEWDWPLNGPDARTYIGAGPGSFWLKVAGPGAISAASLPVSVKVTPNPALVPAGVSAFESTLTEDDVRFGMFAANGDPIDTFLGLSVPGHDGALFARNADYSLVAVMACTCIDDPTSVSNPKPCSSQRLWDCRADPNVLTGTALGGPTGVAARFTVLPFQIGEGTIGAGQVAAPVDAPN